MKTNVVLSTSPKISLPYHLVILSMTSRFHPNLLKGTLAFLYHHQWSSHYRVIYSKAYKTLGMLCRSFSQSVSVSAKCSLYLLLIRSHLQYCPPLWHPHLLADVKRLESVQRRATKFILNDSTMDYKQRLIHLNLLPLMMEFEISDIMFLVKSMKHPSDHLISTNSFSSPFYSFIILSET